MPKSLDEGPSAIVPIKAPIGLRDSLRDCLRDGETISGLTRELWQREITARYIAECEAKSEKKRQAARKRKTKRG
jgi:hypothetical protein